MASIFLSYAREDVLKAKALAKFLERAGHSVWWDRHIHGGAEFSDEIEAALRDAEIVVVLWSQASIKSAWVRDEAAEGRDSGRLLPIQLDDCPPPLGFRQVQSISVAGWSGRGSPPARQTLLDAISARGGRRDSAAPAYAAARSPPRRLLFAGLAAVAAFVAVAGAWWLLNDRSEAASAPVLAVLPFSDLSPEGDKAYFAEGVAEAILTVLAKEPGIRVIGRNSARQLQQAGSEAAEMRQALGITHVLEGSARSAGDQLRMNVRLINASDGRQVWAEEYQRRLDNVFAVQDEIGRSVATRLRGSFGGGGAQAVQPITKADTYALYLAARSKMRDRRISSLTDALKLARRVIAADPKYAPGHALYAELVWHLSAKGYGMIPEAKARAIAERHARRAIALSPDSPDGYAALGMVATREAAIEPLERAIKMDPARAELRQWLGHALNMLGRHEEALPHFRAAVEMDPLWVPGAMLLSYTLAASGRQQAAEQAIAEFEKRGGSPAVAAKVRGDVANYRGDYSEALRLSNVALSLDPQTPQADLSAAWYNFMLGLHEDATSAGARFPLFTRLAMSGAQNRLLDEIRRAGAKVWEQPDPNVAIEALAFARDWESIARLYAAKPDISTVVCADPEYTQMALSLALALRETGRTAEGGRLLQCLRRILTEQGRGEIRSPYLPFDWLNASWAQIHAIEGDANPAFKRMERAVDHGARTPFGRGMSDLPAFDRFRTHAEYARLDARLKQVMARERAEALADRRRAA